MSPRDPNTILACLAGAAACTLFYGTFRVAVWIGRLLWAKRAVPLDPVDAHLDSAPRELTHEVRDEEESDEDAAFILQCEAQLAGRRLRRYERRMGRRSR